MEVSFNQQAREIYGRAQRIAQRDYNTKTAQGERGLLTALDDIIGQNRAVAYMKQPQREIPLNRVVGTYTAARAHSFAGNFMPLHPAFSEFASKWMSLCVAHMSEGLRDPVQVYEYMWQYYVVEGNKRVSILKYFDAPTVQAEITRVVPQLDEDDPETALYYAFLRYDSQGLFKNIQLSSALKYEQLSEIEQKLLTAGSLPDRPNYNAMFLQFGGAYHTTACSLPMGDAFLEYLRVYGLPVSVTMSQVAERISAMKPQLDLISQPAAEPELLLSPAEEPAPGLFSWLKGTRKNARVVFAYPEGRDENNWISAHEHGRQVMQSTLGERVVSSVIDDLTPENVYAKLDASAGEADLLLITASSLTLLALRFALEHPNCLTLVYSRVRQDYRIGTYYGRYYEPVFLCGAAAGMATRTGRVGYITPRIDYKRHTADINAFGLGVKSVRPDAQVYLVWRDVLPEAPETCALGLKTAATLGADVAYTPLVKGLMKARPPEHVLSLVGRLNERGELDSYLAAPQWDWGRYYTEIIRSYLNGSLDILRIIDKGDPSVAGLWWGLGAGVLRFRLNKNLDASGSNLLRYLRGAIAHSHFNPFHGPIRDQDGKLRVSPNNALKPYEILEMEWLCDFIQVID
ncbi:MAG: BMP family ABC transporter substrate-binding protein [Christensenellales bacterium]|jgi:basic membrane protein A